MVYSGAWRKLIHEKNQKLKILWHCPFKGRQQQQECLPQSGGKQQQWQKQQQQQATLMMAAISWPLKTAATQQQEWKQQQDRQHSFDAIKSRDGNSMKGGQQQQS